MRCINNHDNPRSCFLEADSRHSHRYYFRVSLNLTAPTSITLALDSARATIFDHSTCEDKETNVPKEMTRRSLNADILQGSCWRATFKLSVWTTKFVCLYASSSQQPAVDSQPIKVAFDHQSFVDIMPPQLPA